MHQRVGIRPGKIEVRQRPRDAAIHRSCGCAAPSGGCRCGEQHAEVPSIVGRTLASAGAPLDAATRATMGERFGFDFSQVRVHTDHGASASAQAVHARAYTYGSDIVFGANQYQPQTSQGRRLLAHELTHVVQARGSATTRPTGISSADDASEREASSVAARDTPAATGPISAPSSAFVQRDGPYTGGGGTSGGGGASGSWDAPEPKAGASASGSAPASSGGAAAASGSGSVQVCARALQAPGLGLVAGHAYVDAPPFRYAIISPLCPASRFDNPVTGTTAQKWDNSPDPCGKAPTCIDCVPAAGVTNVGACMRSAFSSYNALTLYRATGPNSNTFAGTLARSCCSNMVPKPRAFPILPGWDHAPAAARAGATPCPPGPTC